MQTQNEDGASISMVIDQPTCSNSVIPFDENVTLLTDEEIYDSSIMLDDPPSMVDETFTVADPSVTVVDDPPVTLDKESITIVYPSISEKTDENPCITVEDHSIMINEASTMIDDPPSIMVDGSFTVDGGPSIAFTVDDPFSINLYSSPEKIHRNSVLNRSQNLSNVLEKVMQSSC